ncbi:copper resistance CopC family protein [Motilibacter deserti]|uniref:Copper resistance protein CopC n=1 Tax=Motilibacter deserti TaxID=2714956 RepID=A0ABX0GSZ3_9ACTN|nr:copper resistance CopC family protein [Motilibacter deserti]NHC12794.1 copper resistance protein CopC [Motilibacter deserti]
MRALDRQPPSSRPARRALPAPVATAGALLLALLGVLAPALLLTASPAAAHTALVSSFPSEGEALESGPPQVELDFDEDVSSVGLALVLSGPDGQGVELGQAAADGATVTAPLAAAVAAGAYTLDWRVVSADGHPVSGRVTFSVAHGKPAPAGVVVASAASGDDDASWLSRHGGQLTLVWVVVAVVAAYLVVDALRRRRDRAARDGR